MSTKKILCVDDSVNLLNSLKELFESELNAVEVITARDDVEGLYLARKEQPNLIILDVNLPDMKGDEVLRHLKKHPARKG